MKKTILIGIILFLILPGCKKLEDPYANIAARDIPVLIALTGSAKEAEASFAVGALEKLKTQGAFGLDSNNFSQRTMYKTSLGFGQALLFDEKLVFRMRRHKPQRDGWAKFPLGLQPESLVSDFQGFFRLWDEISTDGAAVTYVFQISHTETAIIIVRQGKIETIW
ncbi:MAG: hypothetical protein ABII88_04815 [Candidatus Omnitrophota bacterium]